MNGRGVSFEPGALYAWIEDAAALAPKLELQKRYGLRGISVWRLGQEDPRVWTQLTPG